MNAWLVRIVVISALTLLGSGCGDVDQDAPLGRSQEHAAVDDGADQDAPPGKSREHATVNDRAVAKGQTPEEGLAVLVYEAEHANYLTYPFEIVESAGASGSLALSIPESAGSSEAFDGDSGAARFHLVVPEEKSWRLSLRVRWNGACSNSLFVRMNGAEPRKVASETFQRWHWVHAGVWDLAAGENELELLNREDGVWVDQVVLTRGTADLPQDSPLAPTGLPAWPGRERFEPEVLLGAPGEAAPGPTDFVLEHSEANRVPLPRTRTVVLRSGQPRVLTLWLRNNSLESASGTARLVTEAFSRERPFRVAAGVPLGRIVFDLPAPADMPRCARDATVHVRHATGRIETRRVRLERPFRWLVTNAVPCPSTGLNTPTALEERIGRGFPGSCETFSWKAAPEEAFTRSGLLDMRQAVADKNFVMAYAYTAVAAPAAGEYLLDVEHDDMMRVWVNGQSVFESQSALPAVLTRKLIKVNLRKGQNDLLVKICQQKNYWEFGVRFLTLERRPAPVTGIEVEVEQKEAQ